ncbi:MAG: Gfo/Idh/MocA family oxidoreductase, partial [Phycisphaerales bacterium]|nr:Gfo/Idh/MocA family oxidoreductase [Phycisphaerales bacterium]
RVGVIGCGGRGTGAAANCLAASPDVEVWALGDVFAERVTSCLGNLNSTDINAGGRARVPKERCFTGFDAYKNVVASGVDIAILATPPHFRPRHLEAAIAAGVHVFMEKPVAVDPAGIRTVLAAAEAASAKKRSIVAGTQRRHERSYLECMSRVTGGELGKIVSARCYWNQGGLWMNPRKPEWSDMEWQLRNWLYFAWLSGDHIVEQHVHNLDVMNWAIGAHPLRAMGMGGRQVRTSPEYGHVFDHFAVEYEYPGGVNMMSMCRQIDGCAGRVEEVIVGTEGTCVTASGRAKIDGAKPWRFDGDQPDPYVQEHIDLIGAITTGRPVNEARQVAESTLTAIMGRMSAYTGKTVTWEQALESKLELGPGAYAFGSIAVDPVAVPGATPLV